MVVQSDRPALHADRRAATELSNEGLYDKARSDRIPYHLWHEQGYLETAPRPSVSYEYVGYDLRQVFDQHRVIKLGFDRWNMSPALRDLESIILERKLRHGGYPVLTMCANNAVVDRDPARNRSSRRSVRQRGSTA